MSGTSGTALAMPPLPAQFSTVTFSFPEAASAEPEPAKQRILLINVDAASRELLCLYLPQAGLEVATVGKAPEAKALVEQGRFDLVLMDSRLNSAEGLSLLRLSKAKHPNIPVMVLAGATSGPQAAEDAFAREADAVIRKSGSLEALALAIFRHLGRCSPASRQAA